MNALRASRSVYPIVSAIVVCGAISLFILSQTDSSDDSALPITFRLESERLSNLPVTITNVRSCGCWFGPRYQAERKFKFGVINDTAEVIQIGGGPQSQVRLIVAYPRRFTPSLSLPKALDSDPYATVASPPDADVRIASGVERLPPNRILAANRLFAVPSNYSVWALPPAPNKVVEPKGETATGQSTTTFATFVDKPELLPGEAYESPKLGHGTWVFYVPLERRLAKAIAALAPAEFVHTADQYEQSVIFVGIAVFARHGSDTADLIGFAPAPSDAALLDPASL